MMYIYTISRYILLNRLYLICTRIDLQLMFCFVAMIILAITYMYVYLGPPIIYLFKHLLTSKYILCSNMHDINKTLNNTIRFK